MYVGVRALDVCHVCWKCVRVGCVCVDGLMPVLAHNTAWLAQPGIREQFGEINSQATFIP